MTRFLAFVLVVLFTAVGVVSPTLAQSNMASSPAKKAARHSGLYDVVPQYPLLNANDPAATGGGSIGYNQMIYNW